MNKKTALIAFLALIVISVIGLSAYLLQGTSKQQKELTPGLPEVSKKIPSSTEPTVPPQPEINTSDWKVYRNEEYGFEVRYPSNWKFWEDYSQVVTIVDFFGPGLEKSPEINYHFGIQIYSLGKASNLREWVENFYPEPEKVTIENTIINGYPAVIARVPVEWAGTGSMSIILRNDNVFTFPIPDEINKTIFSTFKFIK